MEHWLLFGQGYGIGRQSEFCQRMEIVMINALFGRVFLRCADLRQFDGYFTCVGSIRPLLKSPDFESSTPGFYINVSGDLLNSVRLSYFTNEQAKTERVIQEFLDRNRHIVLLKREDAHVRKISERYGGNEARFRNFLHTYTQIGLDLLAYNVLYARRLVAEYRLTYSPQRISSKPLFCPAFKNHSAFFNQLDSAAVAQLWRDLDFWHLGGDWAHMLVNMLLPGDWIYAPQLQAFFLNPAPKLPVTGKVRAELLKGFNLDIPDNWGPGD